MKFTFLSLAFLISVFTFAQSDKYQAAMAKAIADLDSAKTPANFQSVAANFERIAAAEKTQWLPFYYAGLAYSTLGWMDKTIDKDANSEKIIALCNKAEAIEKNSEIYVLKNMAYTQQMLVDPQSRFMSYGSQAAEALQTAEKLDAKNPRVYYMQGMTALGTPEQFGGGKAVAKPLLQKALQLYKDVKPAPLYPNWGQKRAEEALAQCQ